MQLWGSTGSSASVSASRPWPRQTPASSRRCTWTQGREGREACECGVHVGVSGGQRGRGAQRHDGIVPDLNLGSGGKLQSSSSSPAAISALLAVHGEGEAVGSVVARRGGVVRANCSSGRAAFIGGGRLTVDTAQGRCNGLTGVSVGLARGRLRCRATERQGGWRGGERHELDGGGRPREYFGGGWHARAARLRRIWVLAG